EILSTLETRCHQESLSAMVLVDNTDAYSWRFAPIVGATTKSFAIWNVPVALWVRLEFARDAALEGDSPREFEELHDLLAKWPDEPLPGPGMVEDQTVFKFAKERIGALLKQHGREAYEPFDERARELLTAARDSADRSRLELVSELYPFSAAGQEANNDLLRWAIEQGDVEAVSMIAFSELPQVFAPELATDRERQLLLYVGAALEASGNEAYSGALYRTLAKDTPQLESAAPTHASATLSELAKMHPAPNATAPASLPVFEGQMELVHSEDGHHRFLGQIPPATGTNEEPPILLYIHEEPGRFRRHSFVAYSAASLQAPEPEPLWSTRIQNHEIPSNWKNTLVFAPGAVIAATPEGVYALRRSDGSQLWTEEWYATAGDVESVQVHGGLVLTMVRVTGREGFLHALDLASGREVWRAPIDMVDYDSTPLVGDNRVVLMPRRSQRRGRVLDLFSGRSVLEFSLPSKIHQTAHEASWIENGILVVPWFLTGRSPERNHMVAVDLWTGEITWELKFEEILGGQRQLRSILQYRDETYLVLTPVSGAQKADVRGIIAELHVGLGAARQVGTFELDHDDRWVGISQERRVQLQTPTVFLRAFSDQDDAMSVRAIELPLGNTRWVANLGITREQLYNSLLRLPVESDNTVALIFSSKNGGGLSPLHSSLYVLDRATGRGLDVLALDTELGTSNDISLQGLDSMLILGGDKRLEVLR
ncbi:MAG: hypothetical protein ACI9F9_001356, partial [Candidatus Paceibacteria bacterium]